MRRTIFFLYALVIGLSLDVKGETLSGAMEAIQEFLKDHARKETCFLPADLDGQWETTLWGNITISGLMVDTDIRLGGTDITDLQCYLTSDSGNIILRSKKPISQDGEEYEIFTCLELVARNENNYHAIVKTARNAALGNEPLTRRAADDSTIGNKVFHICEKDPEKWVHGDMIRKGNLSSAAVSCPASLTGIFEVTFMSSAEMSRCPNDGLLTSCDPSNGSITFDFAHCNHSGTAKGGSDSISGKSTFWCLGQSDAGIFMSKEGEAMGSFSCSIVQIDPGNPETIVFRQTPGGCGDQWATGPGGFDSRQVKMASLNHVASCEENRASKSVPFSDLPVKDRDRNPKKTVITVNEDDKISVVKIISMLHESGLQVAVDDRATEMNDTTTTEGQYDFMPMFENGTIVVSSTDNETTDDNDDGMESFNSIAHSGGNGNISSAEGNSSMTNGNSNVTQPIIEGGAVNVVPSVTGIAICLTIFLILSARQ